MLKEFPFKPIIGLTLVLLLSGSFYLAHAGWQYITLSSYYVVPGQSITVNGAGFVPNENVTVSVAGSSTQAKTDNSGSFRSSALLIPFGVIGTNQSASAQGGSGDSASANLVVGTFYPTVTPSSWYVVPGGSLNFSGKNFSPNENILVQMAGNTVATSTAAGDGSFTTPQVTIPYLPQGPINFNFIGQTSGVQYTDTIDIAQAPAYLLLSNYFLSPGSGFQVSGYAFGDNETVTISFQGQSLGQATTDSDGQFILNATVPLTSSSGQVTVTAVGNQTGKTGYTTMTVE